MSMKNPLIPAGIEPATFRFVAQHLNYCAKTSSYIQVHIVCMYVCIFLSLKETESQHVIDTSLKYRFV